MIGPVVGLALRLVDGDRPRQPQRKLRELGDDVFPQRFGRRRSTSRRYFSHTAGSHLVDLAIDSTQTVLSIWVTVPMVPLTQRWSASLRRNITCAPTLSSSASSAGIGSPAEFAADLGAGRQRAAGQPSPVRQR